MDENRFTSMTNLKCRRKLGKPGDDIIFVPYYPFRVQIRFSPPFCISNKDKMQIINQELLGASQWHN